MKKKLSFFIDSPGYGGSEADAIKLIKFLHQRSFTVELILNKNACEELKELAAELRLKITFLSTGNRIANILSSFYQFYTKIWQTRNTTCIIWCHHLDSNRWLQFFMALHWFNYIVAERLLPSNYKILDKSKLTIPLKRFIVNKAMAVTICAYNRKAEYENVFSTKNVTVTPNSRDIGKINDIVSVKRKEKEKFIGTKILSIGRITAQKDPLTVIKAIGLLKNAYDVTLIWVGEGELLDACRESVMELNLNQNIFFAGYDKNPWKYLAQADIFILASLTEGLPGALVEAMAAQVPCVATNIPGNNELIIHNVTGLLVPVSDPEKLAESIRWYITNPAEGRAVAKKGFELVREKYDKHIEENAWLNLLGK